MRTVRHTNSRDNLLHIETVGGIVNIRTGLTDHEGRRVTSISTVPDQTTEDTWTLSGFHNTRLIEGKFDPYAEITGLAQQAADAADGDSNDDETEKLRDALEAALDLLGLKFPDSKHPERI